ncbi:unnamed protein product [Rhizophagus irregularis]|nr:unnamed protein product [Rhizophagus irregularis]
MLACKYIGSISSHGASKYSWYISIRGKLSCCACDQADPKDSREARSKVWVKVCKIHKSILCGSSLNIEPFLGNPSGFK